MPALMIRENSLQTLERTVGGNWMVAPRQIPVAVDLERAAPRPRARRDSVFPLLNAISKRHRSSTITNVILMCLISLWTVMIVEPFRSISFAQNSKAVRAVWTILSIWGFVNTIFNARDLSDYNKTGREIKTLLQNRLPTPTSALGTIFGFSWGLMRWCLIAVYVLGPFFW